MNAEARRDAILNQARTGGRLEVEDLARTLGASRETIRRDLAMMDRAGFMAGRRRCKRGRFTSACMRR